MNYVALLELLNMVLRILESAGLNYDKFVAMRNQAKSEGRELTSDELKSLADDAQEAIDRL